MTPYMAVASCLPLVLAAPLVAQATWVVSGGGAALQNAITIAAPGDVLDVQPGLYDPVVCSKGLRIALQSGAEISTVSTSVPALSVTNVPAGETFQVDGGSVRGIVASQCAGTIVVDGVRVELYAVMPFTACSGPIVFDGASYPSVPFVSGHVQFNNCPQVTFRNSAAPQLTITGSRVALQNCTVRPWGFSAPGIQLVSGGLTIAGGYTTGSAAVFFSIARPAIRIDAGELVLTGGATIEALQYPGSWTAVGIEANGGTIRRDPSVSVLGTPPIAGPATVFTVPIPSLAVTHTANTMNVTTRGQAGDVLVTFAGLMAPPFPTPWGDAWLSPGDPILDITLLPASGTGGFSRAFTTVPPFVLLTLQSVAISPAGALQVGAPTRFAWN